MRYIFFLCSERSGSNLTTRMFDAHSAVAGPSPTHLGSDLLGNLDRYDLQDSNEKTAFQRDFLDLFHSKIGAWEFQPDPIWLQQQLEQKGPIGAYLALYAEEARCQDKDVVFIKENRLYLWGDLLENREEPISWLYQVRDPRDMALSWQKAPSLRGGVVRAADIWAQDQAASLAWCHARAESGHPRVPRIHYEALCTDPAPVLRTVCEQLELAFEPDMLEFHQHQKLQQQAAAVKEWRNISRPVMSNNFGKYRDHLNAEQIAYIEATCRPAMQQLAYRAEQPAPKADVLAKLRESLSALEPWEKTAYAHLPLEEKRLRARQQEVLTRIRTRQRRIA